MTADTEPADVETASVDRSGIGRFSRLAPGAFVFAGLFAFLATYGIRRLSVPLADATYQHQFPYFRFPVTLFPHWVEPVTLRPTALFGLKPAVLIATLGLWTGAVVVMALASGFIWWHLEGDEQSSGRITALGRRFGWTSVLAVGAIVVTVGTTDLLYRLSVPRVLGEFVLAVAFGRAFVAPVTIITDGRGPIEAIRWSNRAIGDAGKTSTTVGIVLVVAFFRYFSTVLSGIFGSWGVLAFSVIAGTALLGTVHAFAMLYIYNQVDTQ